MVGNTAVRVEGALFATHEVCEVVNTKFASAAWATVASGTAQSNEDDPCKCGAFHHSEDLGLGLIMMAITVFCSQLEPIETYKGTVTSTYSASRRHNARAS